MNASNCSPYHLAFPDSTNSPAVLVAAGLFYSAVLLAGLLGNLLVVVLTLRQRSLQSVQNVLILNLSVASLLACLISGPLTPLVIIFKEWFFGAPMCHIFPWVQGTSIVVSTFTLAAIALDRFVLIALPHRQPLSRSLATRAVIPAIWLSAGALILPYGYFMEVRPLPGICGEFCDEGWPDDPLLQNAFALWCLVVEFALPFAVISVSYAVVWRRLQAHTGHKLAKLTARGSVGSCGGMSDALLRQEINRRRLRSTSILMATVVVFFVAYLPHNTVSLLLEFTHLFDRNSHVYLYSLVAHGLTMTSVLLNPVLYVFLNPQLRAMLLGGPKHQSTALPLNESSRLCARQRTQLIDCQSAAQPEDTVSLRPRGRTRDKRSA